MSILRTQSVQPLDGETTITLGASGDIVALAAGATATGFGGITKSASDPAVDTNPAGGLGTMWLNTTSGELYSCTDATAGANVWINVGDGTGMIPITYIAATGGTTTTYTATVDGLNYQMHRFTTGGSFAISAGNGDHLAVDVLVAGGGGGGGAGVHSSSNGAGGGAGGLRWFTLQVPTLSTYTVTIGAGGASNTNGAVSSFIGTGISISASGGGAGATGLNVGNTGGSGGGGAGGVRAGGAGNAGSYTPVEGYAGGSTGVNNTSGGGGGAGAVGGNAIDGVRAGFGGVGEDNILDEGSTAFTQAATTQMLTTASVGTLNSSVRYIGGGGTGGDDKTTVYAGGFGGGGTGGSSTAGGAGTVNTGGGGGGSTHLSNTAGGAGGSGVVLIRYRVA